MIVIPASLGIGKEPAKALTNQGYMVRIARRRNAPIKAVQAAQQIFDGNIKKL